MTLIEKFLQTKDEVKIGFPNLPLPIKLFLQRKFNVRPSVPHLYHVTSLCRCLKKSFFTIEYGSSRLDLKGLNNIFRGNIFDRAYTSLFELNQRTYIVTREGVTVSGTYDFVYDDFLYDLKMPSSTFFSKMSGAGLIYRCQVQSYLGLAHVNGDLLDIHCCRVLQIAENVVVTEVAEDPDIVFGWLFPRAFLLDDALIDEDPQFLSGPVEPEWECKFCAASEMFRKEYCG